MIQTLFYFLLHGAAGALAGCVFNRLRKKKQADAREYLVYALFVVVFLLISGTIGELSKYWSIEEYKKWIGALLSIVLFVAILAIRGKDRRGQPR